MKESVNNNGSEKYNKNTCLCQVAPFTPKGLPIAIAQEIHQQL